MIVVTLKEFSHRLECPWEIFPSCGIGNDRWLVKDIFKFSRASDINFVLSQSCEIQVDLWNPSKFTKKHTIPCSSVEILSNACLYNIFETYLSYWGYLLAVNLQIYLETLSLKHANNIPKTTRYRLYCKKLGTRHDVKGFAIGPFLEHVVVERANDDLF